MLGLRKLPTLRCRGCAKQPHEIGVYVGLADDDPDLYENAADYVWQEEGTLNRTTGLFYCDGCYIAAGYPVGKA